MSLSTLRRAASVLVPMFIIACGGGGSDDPNPVSPKPPDPVNPTPNTPAAVATVAVTPATATLAPGTTAQLTASARDAQGNSLSGRTIAWTSSAPDKATVNSSGLVTAVATGTATITATSEGKAGTAQISIVRTAANVAVSSPTSTLVPSQTLQLTAVVTDTDGEEFTNPSLTWKSSNASVATVDAGSGEVTAVAVGSVTISAEMDGKSGSVDLSVVDGTVVGSSGGVVADPDSNVVISIPSGALAEPTVIILTRVDNPSLPAPGEVEFNGPAYSVSPQGIIFSKPVTVTLRYDVNTLPGWTMTGDLGVFLSNGSQWTELANPTVDVANGTVSGRSNGFGVGAGSARFRIAGAGEDEGPQLVTGVNYAVAQLSPNPGSVNFQTRWVNFTVSLTPTGVSIPLPVATGEENIPLWKYRWRTTGVNGQFTSGNGMSTDWTTENEIEYLATNPNLNELKGEIDKVYVDVLMNPSEENNPSAWKVVTREASINADLKLSYDVFPDRKTIKAGKTGTMQVVIRDADGEIIEPTKKPTIKWGTTGYFGRLSNTEEMEVTYEADASPDGLPPYVDKVNVSVEGKTDLEYREPFLDMTVFPPVRGVKVDTMQRIDFKGEAEGFVTVEVDYEVSISPETVELSGGEQQQFTVTLRPEFKGDGIEYKYSLVGDQGQITDMGTGRTTSNKVTYKAKDAPTGGTDKLKVEVVSVLAGVELTTIGTAEATIKVDNWRAGSVSVYLGDNGGGGYEVLSRLLIPKVSGAGSYHVIAELPDQTIDRTFSGATTDSPIPVGEVVDLGSNWGITLSSWTGNNYTAATKLRDNLQALYYGSTVKYKVTM